MLVQLANKLYTPGAARLFQRLYDEKQYLEGAIIRDGINNVGEMMAARDRSQNDFRETTFNEWTTTFYWGFGIRILKSLYESAIQRFGKIEYPKLDISVFEKGPQQLTREAIERFTPHLPAASRQKLYHLLEASTKNQYQRLALFLKTFAITFIPAAIIGFCIPRINHYVTRHIIATKQHGKPEPQLVTPPGVPFQAPGGLQNPLRSVSSLPVSLPIVPLNTGRFPVSLNPAPLFPMPGVSIAPTLPWPAVGEPGFPWRSMPAWRPSIVSPPPKVLPLQFGSLSAGLSKILQNDRLSNILFMDVPISGGRILTADRRTDDRLSGFTANLERLEWIVKEGGFLFAQYMLSGWVQKLLINLSGKSGNTLSRLDFPVISNLMNAFKGNPQGLQQTYHQALTGMGFSSLEMMQELRQSQSETLSGQLVERISDYFAHHEQNKGKNLIFELSEEMGWVKTWRSEPPGKGFRQKFLRMMGWANERKGTILARDLTQKIDVDSVYHLVEELGGLATHPQLSKQGFLEKTLQHAMKRKMGIFIASNTVTLFFLAYLFPRIKRKIPYWLTGENYFPGISPQEDKLFA